MLERGQNAFVESFNSKLRDECLNEYVFGSLGEARETIERWRQDYNHLRPHSSLSALTPSEFAALKREQGTPPPGRWNNRRTLLINGGKSGCRPTMLTIFPKPEKPT